MFCVNCGQKLPEDSKYCFKCGSAVLLADEKHIEVNNQAFEEEKGKESTKTLDNKKKKINVKLVFLAIFLLAVAIFVGRNIYVRASDTIEVDGILFEKENNEYRVIGYSEVPAQLVVPSEIYGKPVVAIGWAAFSGCETLTSVTIPESIKKIEGGAFSECKSLQKIHISNLGAWCNISFGSGDSNPLFASSSYDTDLCLNGKEISGDVVIPDNATKIWLLSFTYCEKITSVYIPKEVQEIENCAFANCPSLTKVTIERGDRLELGVALFENSPNLTQLIYTGTIQEWQNVEKPERWIEDSAINEIICEDGIISIS